MKRHLFATLVLGFVAAGLSGETLYLVYRGTEKLPYDYYRSDPWEGWENHAGTSYSLMLFDLTVDDVKAPSLNRLAAVSFWTQPDGRFYMVGDLSSGVRLYDFGNGTGALVSVQPWTKVASGVDMGVLLYKAGGMAPPKSMKGTGMLVAPDEEIRRAEISLKLDSKLTAAAAAAAAAHPGDPFGAAVGVIEDAVEAMGYVPVP